MSDPTQQTDAGFDVLNQVLSAEKKAAQRVEAARQEAARIVQEAQDEARRLTARADRRIQLLHRCQRDELRAADEDLKAAFEQERRDGARGDDAGDIAAVTAELARKLIGLTPG